MQPIFWRIGRRRSLQFLILLLCSVLTGVLVATLLSIYPWGEVQPSSPSPNPKQVQQTPITEIQPDPTATLSPSPTSAVTATPTPAPSPTPVPTFAPTATPKPTSAISPLLLGTNLSLHDGNDQVLTSSATRTLIQQMHAGIIRIPTRADLPESLLLQAAQAVKSLGAIPLVILQGSEINPNALQYDLAVITTMNNLFGKGIVYYEYGNEEDFLGVPVDKYTSSWNAVIPQLKQLALNGRFLGPVTYHYDPVYLKAFLQAAQPRPDMASWHEYVCSASAPDSDCMARLDNWNRHMAEARATMQAAIGTTLPIMITEWNYSPVTSPNDGKNNDSTFMTAWTTKALQLLAANNIYAAMQYSCTGSAIPLVDGNNALTAQGAVFKSFSGA